MFGIIYFSISLATIASTVLELGISATTVREVSRYFPSQREYVSALIQTASSIYWILALAILVGIFVVAPLLAEHWINLKTTASSTAVTMIRILSISTAVVLPRALYTSLFRGRQRMAINNTIDVASAVVQQLGILVVLRLGGGEYLVAGWISASALAAVLAYILVASRLFGWAALVPRLDSAVVTRNRSFAAFMMSNSLLSLVYTQSDKVIVSKLLPIADFGIYGFASATVGRANFVTAAITQAAFPSLSGLFESGDKAGLFRQYRKLQDMVCYTTLPMFATICFAAQPVYRYLFNATIAQRLLLPTVLLAVGYSMNAALNTPYVMSLAVGKPHIAAKANIVGLFVVLPVTVLLIAAFGIAGAAFSWVFYHLFAYVYMVPRICRECLEMPASRWYLHALRAFGLAVIAYGFGWFVIASGGSFSLVALIIGYIVGSAVFLVGAYRLIGPDLRETLTRFRQTLMVRMAGAL